MKDCREQVEYLAAMSRLPHVELRIRRFEDGPPAGIHSMVSIFGFPVDEVGKPESVSGYT